MASIYKSHLQELPVFIQEADKVTQEHGWSPRPPRKPLIQSWFRHKARDNILQEIFRTLPFPPVYFVNYCLCTILKYYSIMSLPPNTANQDCPPQALLQWGSLSQVDSWGSEVSEVLPLSSQSWISWKAPCKVVTDSNHHAGCQSVPVRGLIFPSISYYKWPHHTRGGQIELSRVYGLQGDVRTFVQMTGHTRHHKWRNMRGQASQTHWYQYWLRELDRLHELTATCEPVSSGGKNWSHVVISTHSPGHVTTHHTPRDNHHVSRAGLL